MPSRKQFSPRQKADVAGGYGVELKPCAVCSVAYDTCVDHILPLALGGSNERANLQPLCAPCNLRKGGRWTNDELIAWFRENEAAIRLARRQRYGARHGW